MSKLRLIFFRHAKSDWSSGAQRDIDRPLNARGRATAPRMGELLASSGQVPTHALVSPATRARETYELASKAGKWETELRVEEGLYESYPEQVLQIVRRQPADVRSLLLVGHEPVWSEMVSGLIGEATVRFPTAAMARVDLPVKSWDDIFFGGGQLVWLLQPRFFTDGE